MLLTACVSPPKKKYQVSKLEVSKLETWKLGSGNLILSDFLKSAIVVFRAKKLFKVSYIALYIYNLDINGSFKI